MPQLIRDLPLTGSISHSMIQAEWGLSGKFRLSADGASLIDKSPSTNIKESDFRGKSASKPIIEFDDANKWCYTINGYHSDASFSASKTYMKASSSRSTFWQSQQYWSHDAGNIYIETGTQMQLFASCVPGGSWSGGSLVWEYYFGDWYKRHTNFTGNNGARWCINQSPTNRQKWPQMQSEQGVWLDKGHMLYAGEAFWPNPGSHYRVPNGFNYQSSFGRNNITSEVFSYAGQATPNQTDLVVKFSARTNGHGYSGGSVTTSMFGIESK